MGAHKPKPLIPRGFSLLGIYHAVEVRKFTESDDGDGGLYDPDSRIISIDTARAPHTHHELLCHEVAEGINDMLNLRLPHHVISAFGLGFHDFFYNNLKVLVGDKGESP